MASEVGRRARRAPLFASKSSEHPRGQLGVGTLAGAGISAAFIVFAAVPALAVAQTVLTGPNVVPAIAAATLVVVGAARAMFRTTETE